MARMIEAFVGSESGSEIQFSFKPVYTGRINWRGQETNSGAQH